MSDHAPAQIIFYHVDPRDHDDIIAWLRDWDLSEQYTPGAVPTTTIEYGTVYGDDDAGLGILLDGVTALIEAAPGSTWKLTQDAKYEFDGEHVHYVPGLGHWAGRCTQDGTPTFTRDEVMRAAMDGTLDQLTGGPWLRAIETIEARQQHQAKQEQEAQR